MPNHSGAGDQFPGVGDGVALEVVAEAEVAEHLEEGVVAASEADVLEVVVLAAGANAFLRRGGARVVALLGPEENVLELVHARVGEEQRRIVGRHQRRRVHAAVALGLKEAQKQLANFVSRTELHVLTSVMARQVFPQRAVTNTEGTAIPSMQIKGDSMDRFALLALLEAKPGKEKEVEEFLKSAQPMAAQEPGTSTWYAVKLGPARFGIFDTFRDEAGPRGSPFRSRLRRH